MSDTQNKPINSSPWRMCGQCVHWNRQTRFCEVKKQPIAPTSPLAKTCPAFEPRKDDSPDPPMPVISTPPIRTGTILDKLPSAIDPPTPRTIEPQKEAIQPSPSIKEPEQKTEKTTQDTAPPEKEQKRPETEPPKSLEQASGNGALASTENTKNVQEAKTTEAQDNNHFPSISVEVKIWREEDWEMWRRLDEPETQYHVIQELYHALNDKGVLEQEFEDFIRREIYRYLPEETIEKAKDENGRLKIELLWNKLKSNIRAELMNQFLRKKRLLSTIALNKYDGREYYVLYGYNNIVVDTDTWGFDILTLLFGSFMSSSVQRDITRIMKATAKPVDVKRFNPSKYMRLTGAILDLETLNLVKIEEVQDYYFDHVMPVFTSKSNLDHLRLAIKDIAEGRYDIRLNKVYQLFRPRFVDDEEEQINDDDEEKMSMNWKYLISSLGIIPSPKKAKLLAVLIGKPNVGKTTFLKIIKKPIEPIVASVSLADIQRDKFGKEPLLGKQVLITSETRDVFITKVGVLNEIFGEGDTISVNRKNQKYVEMESLKMGIISTNDPPIIQDKVSGAVEALINRLNLIYMVRPPNSENIDGLADMISPEEAFNFLLWCRVWLENHNWQIVKPTPEEILNTLRENSNTAYQFLNMATDLLDFEPNCRMKVKRLYELYEKWCKKQGIKPMSRNYFYDRLRDKGYELYEREGAYWVKGICEKGAPRDQTLDNL